LGNAQLARRVRASRALAMASRHRDLLRWL